MSTAGQHRAISFIEAADDQLTIFDRSRPGRRAFMPPPLDVPERPLDELLPATLRRAIPAALPEVSEPEIVRHYNRLSKRNFDLDTGFYPLGSCTMKHNPKLHERVAALPGNSRLHPLQRPAAAQGGSRGQAKPPTKAASPKASGARPAPAKAARRAAASVRETHGPSPGMALAATAAVLVLALGVTLATGHRGQRLVAAVGAGIDNRLGAAGFRLRTIEVQPQ